MSDVEKLHIIEHMHAVGLITEDQHADMFADLFYGSGNWMKDPEGLRVLKDTNFYTQLSNLKDNQDD